MLTFTCRRRVCQLYLLHSPYQTESRVQISIKLAGLHEVFWVTIGKLKESNVYNVTTIPFMPAVERRELHQTALPESWPSLNHCYNFIYAAGDHSSSALRFSHTRITSDGRPSFLFCSLFLLSRTQCAENYKVILSLLLCTFKVLLCVLLYLIFCCYSLWWEFGLALRFTFGFVRIKGSLSLHLSISPTRHATHTHAHHSLLGRAYKSIISGFHRLHYWCWIRFTVGIIGSTGCPFANGVWWLWFFINHEPIAGVEIQFSHRFDLHVWVYNSRWTTTSHIYKISTQVFQHQPLYIRLRSLLQSSAG